MCENVALKICTGVREILPLAPDGASIPVSRFTTGVRTGMFCRAHCSGNSRGAQQC